MRQYITKLNRIAHQPKLISYAIPYLLGERRLRKTNKAYQKGELILNYPPLKIRIEPTNNCNLKCKICPTGIGHDKPRGFMDMATYSEIIRQATEFPKPTWIILYLAGEPLMHPSIVGMIIKAKERGLFTRIVTNATLLTSEKQYALLKSGLDSLEFSFDEMPPEQYESVRVNAKYTTTLNNILSFLNRKKQSGQATPLITISALRLRDKDNLQGPPVATPEYTALFKDYPVTINRYYAHLWAGDFPDKSEYHYQRTPEKSPGCLFPWVDLTVNWNGDVVACCLDLLSGYVSGNVRDKSLLNLWNSPGMVALRMSSLPNSNKQIELCQNCSVMMGEI